MSRFGLIVVVFAWLWWSAPARAEKPLYDEEPYDQITLDAANNHAVLKIKPLDPKNRKSSDRPRSEGKLVVYLIDAPDKAYEVLWRSVAKVELFEQLVLNKANELVEAGEFEQAYDYFTFLERNKPKTPGLAEAVENYLYEEAKYAHRRGQYDGALALMRELYRRNPHWPGLDTAMGRTTDLLVDHLVRQKDYVAARVLLRNLSSAFPNHSVAARWNDQFEAEAAPLLVEARAAIEAGQWAKAADLSHRITALWPALPGARELARTIHQKYLRIVVGVGTLAAAGQRTPGRIDDWAARRCGRLLYRTLTEFAGPSAEGGQYDCPVGEIFTESLGRRMVIQLKPGIHWAAGSATLCNADVAQRLLAMADPGDAAFRLDWSDLLAAVSLRGAYGVQVDLRRVHVRPEAMLQIVLTPWTAPAAPGELPPGNGPLVVQAETSQETVFVANRQYFADEPGRPMEIIERRYALQSQAVSALRRGEIDVLDRLNPWSVAALRSQPGVVVQPYALPLIHCLVANPRRPLLGERTFRRALSYGIHREAILKQMLSGADIPGCTVTSSPFPLGVGPNDPMGYASDDNIEPRPFDPRMALALGNVALKNYLDSLEKQKDAAKAGEQTSAAGEQKDATQDQKDAAGEQKDAAKNLKDAKGKAVMPKLILAHPSDEIASAACASIQKQFKLVGIPIELRPIAGPLPERIPDDVDLMYVELSPWEPVIDARRLLGENGIAGQCSPYMSLALRQLDEATEWVQVRECLRRVHRIAFDETVVMPLWQLIDHFAYRESLRGMAARPVSLYQNVEQWRTAFQYPSEK